LTSTTKAAAKRSEAEKTKMMGERLKAILQPAELKYVKTVTATAVGPNANATGVIVYKDDEELRLVVVGEGCIAKKSVVVFRNPYTEKEVDECTDKNNKKLKRLHVEQKPIEQKT
jgi:hypothetical protein